MVYLKRKNKSRESGEGLGYFGVQSRCTGKNESENEPLKKHGEYNDEKKTSTTDIDLLVKSVAEGCINNGEQE